jgi:hypothetical protein
MTVLNWVFKKYGKSLSGIHLPVADKDISGSMEVHPVSHSMDTGSHFLGAEATRELSFILHPLPLRLHDAETNCLVVSSW